MDIWHGWLAKLAVAQILYLFVVIWGMRALNRWRFARIRASRTSIRQSLRTATMAAPAPFQKL